MRMYDTRSGAWRLPPIYKEQSQSDEGQNGEEERRMKDIRAHLIGLHWTYIRL